MDFTRLLRTAVIGVAASTAFAAAGMAQSVPAEVPPASYGGTQYVDSEGCVFVRVGVGAATDWIPRVGRDRQQICGQTPTLGGRTASAPAPSTASAGDNGIVIIGGTGATTSTTTGATGRAPRTTTAARPMPTAAAAAAAAPRVVQTPTTRTVAPSAPVSGGASACTAANARFFTGPNVRCGPQAVHPGPGGSVLGPRSDLGGSLGVQPAPIVIPEGYRAAFDDGRLNPQRGLGTPRGEAQMAAIWTDTVPRRLVADEPVQRVVRTPLITPEGAERAPAAEPADGAVAGSDAASASTTVAVARSRAVIGAEPSPTPEVEAVRVAPHHRHVLAATFSSRADADRAFAALSARGLPMRLGQIDRSGGMVYAVVAGPFADTNALVAGLRQTQAAGYTGAVTRR